MTNQQENSKKSFVQKNPWIIIPGILVMGYLVFTEYKDLVAEREERESWNKKDFKNMMDQCIRDSKDMAVKYPELTKEYCDCSTKQVQASMTKSKYNATTQKSISEQKDIILPVIQNCLTEYQNKIKVIQPKEK